MIQLSCDEKTKAMLKENVGLRNKLGQSFNMSSLIRAYIEGDHESLTNHTVTPEMIAEVKRKNKLKRREY